MRKLNIEKCHVSKILSDTKQNDLKPYNNNVVIKSARSSPPKVNEFDYEYILRPNESFCETGNNNSLLLIAFVPISPKNFKQRNTIRSTWANHQLIKNFRVGFKIGQSYLNFSGRFSFVTGNCVTKCDVWLHVEP
jgi:hypothetical protein